MHGCFCPIRLIHLIRWKSPQTPNFVRHQFLSVLWEVNAFQKDLIIRIFFKICVLRPLTHCTALLHASFKVVPRTCVHNLRLNEEILSRLYVNVGANMCRWFCKQMHAQWSVNETLREATGIFLSEDPQLIKTLFVDVDFLSSHWAHNRCFTWRIYCRGYGTPKTFG